MIEYIVQSPRKELRTNWELPSKNASAGKTVPKNSKTGPISNVLCFLNSLIEAVQLLGKEGGGAIGINIIKLQHFENGVMAVFTKIEKNCHFLFTCKNLSIEPILEFFFDPREFYLL